jgi:hypothetical protein
MIFGTVVAYVAVVSALWGLRNVLVLGEPVLFATSGGYNFWGGNNPNASGGPIHLPASQDPRLNLAVLRDECTINREGYRLGWQWIREHPSGFLALVPRRVRALYGSDLDGIYQAFLYAPLKRPTPLERVRQFGGFPERLASGTYFVVLFVALLGLLRANWRRPEVQVLGQTWAYWTVSFLPFFAKDRFHVPIMPVICLFAAGMIWQIACVLRQQAKGEGADGPE